MTNKFKIYIFAPGKKEHMTLKENSPTCDCYDGCINHLKSLGTTYYTLYEIDGEDTFLFYSPILGPDKYIIKSVPVTI